MTTQDKKKKQFIPDSELINVSGGKKGSSKAYTESSNTPSIYYC